MQVCVTGMHRSGTSLMAGLFQAAGVSMGINMLGPGAENPHGFFEDMDIVNLHNNVMMQDDRSFLDAEGFSFAPKQEHDDYLANLLAAREQFMHWGWKDPRTVLFLDYWRQKLPRCNYVFVYRHPLEVLQSLLKRRDQYIVGVEEGLAGWVEYNKRILTFVEQHPGSCLLGHVKGILADFKEFGRTFNRKFSAKLPLDEKLLKANYHPKSLHELQPSAEALAVLDRLMPQCLEVYEGLEKAADFTDPDQAMAPKGTDQEKALVEFVAAQKITADSPFYRGVLQMWAALLFASDMDSFFADYLRKQLRLDKERLLLSDELQTYRDVVTKIEPTLQAMQQNLDNKSIEIASLRQKLKK
jgi:hypothetical protein